MKKRKYRHSAHTNFQRQAADALRQALRQNDIMPLVLALFDTPGYFSIHNYAPEK